MVAVAAFLDAFQKVADLATNSRGRSTDTDKDDCVFLKQVVFSCFVSISDSQ